MRIETSSNGITLIREDGDKRIPKESTVAFHIRNLLNGSPYSGKEWVRIYPDRYGLTACKIGVANHKEGIIYWHERYAIELAHEEFNKHGRVFLLKA